MNRWLPACHTLFRASDLGTSLITVLHTRPQHLRADLSVPAQTSASPCCGGTSRGGLRAGESGPDRAARPFSFALRASRRRAVCSTWIRRNSTRHDSREDRKIAIEYLGWDTDIHAWDVKIAKLEIGMVVLAGYSYKLVDASTQSPDSFPVRDPNELRRGSDVFSRSYVQATDGRRGLWGSMSHRLRAPTKPGAAPETIPPGARKVHKQSLEVDAHRWNT
ncbi:hypothetical protein BKA93DRAFT_368229 [Sparassis latifolia]